MEKVVKELVFSEAFYKDLKAIYSYGMETFGVTMAEIFQEQIMHVSKVLNIQYLIHPECKHLKQKARCTETLSLENT